jgi:PAS domain S-box-containing protein
MAGSIQSADECFRMLFEQAPAAIVVQDAERDRFVDANSRASELLRMSREQLLERSFALVDARGTAGAATEGERLREWIAAALAGRPFLGEWTCVDALGLKIPCQLRMFHLPSSGSSLVCGIIVDLREERAARERLRRSREQLRALSGQLQDAIEDERARISRELHDQLGQLMTAARMNVAGIVRSIEKLPPEQALRGELLSRTSATSDVIDEMLDRAKTIAGELRPEGLDALGLPVAMTADLDVFASRTGIEVMSEIDPKAVSLPKKVSAVLLRCMTELLTNVARHAQASRVGVRLTYESAAVMLEVQDDGVGMDEAARRSSLGIVGMEERVAALEGTVRFGPGGLSKKREGTSVVVEIPFIRPPA